MLIGTRGVLDWVLAAVTAAAWFAMYALFFSRDPDVRRKLRLTLWRWRHQLLPGARRGPRAVPPALLARPAPVRRAPPPPPPARRALPAAVGNAARALAVPEPIRIAEWRADRLPLRYRLLGQPRRGVNDN